MTRCRHSAVRKTRRRRVPDASACTRRSAPRVLAPLDESTAIVGPSRVLALTQGHVPMRVCPDPALDGVCRGALAGIGRIEQVFWSEDAIDVPAVQALVLQDVEGMEAARTVISGVQAQLDRILIRLGFPCRTIE